MKNRTIKVLELTRIQANTIRLLIGLACFALFCLGSEGVWAQAPTISYTAPPTYTVGKAITALTPTSANVAAPQYGTAETQIGSGFQNPGGTSEDAAGNVYVAVYQLNEVVKVPAGNGTPVVIGSGFYEPNDVKVDAAGNVFVADQGNSEIKEIPGGTGTPVVLGSGFSYPSTIALDAADNIYIADPGNGAVKRMPVTGGTPVTIGYFNNPFGVGVDGNGNVYVTDATFDLYEIPAAGGAPITLATGFNNPNLIGVDASGNVFISDSNNSVIKMYTAGSGALITLPASFGFPFAVSVDSKDNIYVSDENNSTVNEVSPVGGYYIHPALPQGLLFNSATGVISGTPTVASAATTYTITAFNTSGSKSATVSIKVVLPGLPTLSYVTPQNYTVGTAITALSPTSTNVTPRAYSNSPIIVGSGFAGPEGTAVDAAGNIYVADPNNSEVKKIPAGGGTPLVVGSGFSLPTDVALDGAGNLYVADYLNSAIYEIKAGTNTPVAIGSGFYHPFGVAADAAGNVFVGDQGHNMVKEIPVSGGPPVILASGGLVDPDGLCADAAGNVYFADLGNNAIKKIPITGGAIVTVGTGFTQPASVAVDAEGNLFVADRNNNAIKEVYANTNTTVTIGSNINYPNGVSVDAAGNVWAGDYGNNAVKEIKPAGGYFISPALPAGLTYANGTGVISGTPTAPSPAITYTAADFNAAGSAKASLSIAVADPGGVTLSALALSTGTLDPVFATGTTRYEVSVANTVPSLTVTPTAATGTSILTVNGKAVTSGSASAAISLVAGRNIINVVVTASGGKVSQTYTILVFKAESTNAYLKALTVSSGTLSPTFAAGGFTYTDKVASNTTSITITPTLSATTSTLTVNGVTVASGTASAAIALNTGTNAISVVITAQDGSTTKTYTINVIVPATNAYLSALAISSGTLAPAFSSTTYSYTASVSTASITLTPTVAQANATVKVNGTTVASGTASGAIALTVGSNTITTVVTAQDGITTETYTLKVTRSVGSANAALSNLVLSGIPALTPAFKYTTTSYTASVANTVTSLTVTPTSADATATIKVNGVAVTSKTASGVITLAVGTNTITTVVTAGNGTTTDTYTVVVTRAASAIATLSAFKISTGTLSPAFASGTTSYITSLAASVASITITPTTTNASATVKVNGVAVTSGTASGAITLGEGMSIITTVVTAQDGSTTDTYTLTVYKGDTNAALSNLVLSGGTALSPAFKYTTTSYTASVANSVSSITVTPTTADATATVTVNGTAVASKSASAAIALAVGTNTITVVVTAENGLATETYTVVVTRAASGADGFDPGISVSSPTETPVLADDGINVHKGVSPNGDGIDDYLQIDNISQYPDNRLTIMNRNGQLVFEASGYDNASRVFDGHSNKNGQMQQPGTYFYQLDYTVNGITRHKTGFLVLKY